MNKIIHYKSTCVKLDMKWSRRSRSESHLGCNASSEHVNQP